MTKVVVAEEYICFPREPPMTVPKCKDQPVLVVPLAVEINKWKLKCHLVPLLEEQPKRVVRFGKLMLNWAFLATRALGASSSCW